MQIEDASACVIVDSIDAADVNTSTSQIQTDTESHIVITKAEVNNVKAQRPPNVSDVKEQRQALSSDVKEQRQALSNDVKEQQPKPKSDVKEQQLKGLTSDLKECAEIELTVIYHSNAI